MCQTCRNAYLRACVRHGADLPGGSQGPYSFIIRCPHEICDVPMDWRFEDILPSGNVGGSAHIEIPGDVPAADVSAAPAGAPAAQPPVDRFIRATLVEEKPGSALHTEALAAFTATGKDGRGLDPRWIKRVFRVVNPGIESAYRWTKAYMVDREDKGGIGANEQFLYHVTDRMSSGMIIRRGFDIRLSGSRHGQALGPGIYMAATPAFAHIYRQPDIVGNTCMVVCRVLVGEAVTRRTATKGGHPAGDSVVDDPRTPAQYAIPRERQICPAYVVYYRETNRK